MPNDVTVDKGKAPSDSSYRREMSVQGNWGAALRAEDTVFVAEPPPAIGATIGAWTNNGKRGPVAMSAGVRLMPVAIGAGLGLVIGLVGFFVVAGVMQSHGANITGDSFLLSLGGGVLLGALLGLPSALRRASVLTLFVGSDGCAQIDRRGVQLLEFKDVQGIRTHVRIMTFKGIRTSVREFHVTASNGKERLWYLSSVPAEHNTDDPQVQFGDAVLHAFAAYRTRGR